ncbi:MAG TPA: phosphate ABC transporter permease subunit PstC [Chloroflexota bacterium]|nr:phosphate ABC transporter permease subunit PstC [Chloroflexota bacterium]
MEIEVTESPDQAVNAASVSVVVPPHSTRSSRRSRVDAFYHWGSFVVSLAVVIILVAILLVLISTAWPAITAYGPGFLAGTVWNPTINVYGAAPFIVGTLMTTGLALLIAVPISIGIAILLTEYAPGSIAGVIGVVIDVAAGVPTIVFGAWALLELLPWMSNTAEPAIAAVFGWFPPLDPNNSPTGITGYGIFTAGLVLSAMIFPTIVSVTRGSFAATPLEMREASLGIGATRWETATRVVMRGARTGMLGAIVLACGRALGETMAVVYVIGLSPRIPQSLFDQGHTLSTILLTQLFGGNASSGTMTAAALYELGLILLALSLLAGLAGRYLTRRLSGALVLGGGR